MLNLHISNIYKLLSVARGSCVLVFELNFLIVDCHFLQSVVFLLNHSFVQLGATNILSFTSKTLF